jgi:hypothetical protein
MDEHRHAEPNPEARKRLMAGIIYRGRLHYGAYVGPQGARIVIGLLVIALGVLFTLDNLGMVGAGDVLRWWPSLLLIYGLSRLTGFCCRQGTVIGTIFTIAGALLLLREARLLPIDPWDFWPVVLIVIGAVMVTRALQRVSGRDEFPASGAGVGPGGDPVAGAPASGGTVAGDHSPEFHTFALWSGVEHKILSQQLRRGDVAAIRGGQTLDLRGARLAGGTAIIDLVVLMGGVDLYVPPAWKVSVEAVTLLGGFEDATRAPAGEASGHLILRGVVLMGGVDVKN